MNVPIKDAIVSGDWLHFNAKEFLSDDINFRVRILSIERINKHDIDDPQKIGLDEGILWLMRIEVVNMCKTPLRASEIRFNVVLCDQDGFVFEAVDDDHLIYRSDYAKSTGLNRFAGWSDIRVLMP